MARRQHIDYAFGYSIHCVVLCVASKTSRARQWGLSYPWWSKKCGTVPLCMAKATKKYSSKIWRYWVPIGSCWTLTKAPEMMRINHLMGLMMESRFHRLASPYNSGIKFSSGIIIALMSWTQILGINGDQGSIISFWYKSWSLVCHSSNECVLEKAEETPFAYHVDAFCLETYQMYC